ncbi:unnamed protein product [Mortierella alpina]
MIWTRNSTLNNRITAARIIIANTVARITTRTTFHGEPSQEYQTPIKNTHWNARSHKHRPRATTGRPSNHHKIPTRTIITSVRNLDKTYDMGNLSQCVILLCLALQVLATKSVVTFGDKFSYNGPSMLRNGRVWPEYLASMVGATWRSSIDTQDTAGGFKSVENQVLVYCRSRDIDAHALHTLWVGVDDLVGSFISGFEAIKGGKNVSSLLETLYGCGGRKFLVLGVPAIHYMPLIRRSSGVNENRIEEFKQQILTYNIDLEDTVNVFAASSKQRSL